VDSRQPLADRSDLESVVETGTDRHGACALPGNGGDGERRLLLADDLTGQRRERRVADVVVGDPARGGPRHEADPKGQRGTQHHHDNGSSGAGPGWRRGVR
jgi:hypothetical protein